VTTGTVKPAITNLRRNERRSSTGGSSDASSTVGLRQGSQVRQFILARREVVLTQDAVAAELGDAYSYGLHRRLIQGKRRPDLRGNLGHGPLAGGQLEHQRGSVVEVMDLFGRGLVHDQSGIKFGDLETGTVYWPVVARVFVAHRSAIVGRAG